MNLTAQNYPALPEAEDAFSWPQDAARKSNWVEAAKRWCILQHAYPNHPTVWFNAIDAYIIAGKLDCAERIQATVSKKFPNHPKTLLQDAKIKLLQDKSEKAADLLAIAREKFPNMLETWLQSGDYALRKGLFDLAAQYNQEARHRFPEHPFPYKQYAEMAMASQDWEAALTRWETFRQRFPEHPAGYNLAAIAAEKAGNAKLARKLKLAKEYGQELLSETEELSTGSLIEKKHRHATFSGLIELIWTKAIFNLRSETQRNYLSYLWWVLEPLLHMSVYYIVFGFLLQRGGENFTVFLLTGLVPWIWFSKSITGCSNSIVAGQGLMLQVGIPSIVFPLVSLVQVGLKQIPVFLVLFAFIWSQDLPLGAHWLALIPIFMVQLLLTSMIGCLLAALVPFVRDVSLLIPTALSFVMFLSGIFYSYKQIPIEWQDIFLLNPIAFILKCYREVFIDGTNPDFYMLGVWAIISIIGCTFTLIAYKKLRYVFPRVVLS